MYVVINKKHIEVNHVKPIKSVGAVFPKAGTQAVIITKNGREFFDLSDGGEFCRLHESISGNDEHCDAFMYVEGEWFKVLLNTVDYVSKKKF